MIGVTLGANMVPAMAGKEKSLSRSVQKQNEILPLLIMFVVFRYPGWSDYISTSGFFFPKISI